MHVCCTKYENVSFSAIENCVRCAAVQVEVPFLEREVLEVQANQLPLYKLMFVPALGSHPTLALIGFIRPLGSTFCVAEMQSRLAALVFKVFAH